VLWRPTAVEDLETALAIDPYSLGDEMVGRPAALSAYRKLVRSRRFLSAVVERDLRNGRRQIVGWGGAIFVSDALFRREISDPTPGLNARIVASIAEGSSAVLSHEEIRRANTHGGLNLVVTHAAWVRNAFNADEMSTFERVMSEAFFQLVRGYRLLRLFREAGSREAIEHVKSQRVFATMLTFDAFHAANPENRWNRDRALFVAEREHCLALPASVASMLFSYSEPTLRLHDADQELLIAASCGSTDVELARVLKLKLPTLKKRWASLFARVRDIRPDLVPYPDGATTRTRGPQKRHRLLAYLKDHPEELRPRLHKPATPLTGSR
jgi:hypothetical protein